MLAEWYVDPLSAVVYAVVSGAIMGVLNSLQSWRDSKEKKRIAAELKAEMARKAEEDALTQRVIERAAIAAAVNSKKSLNVNTANSGKFDVVIETAGKTYEAVNGSGLGGQLKELKDWAANHEALDAERHGQLVAKIEENTAKIVGHGKKPQGR